LFVQHDVHCTRSKCKKFNPCFTKSNNMGAVNVDEYCKKIAMKNVNIFICAFGFVWRLKVLKSQGQHNSDIQPLANALANKPSPEKQDTLTNIQSTLIETNNVRFMNLSLNNEIWPFYTTPPKWKSEINFDFLSWSMEEF
jgi:uncharacterized protein YozE (UPF0346 family)